MRRIVTGHDAQGKAVFLSDGEPPRRVVVESLPSLGHHEIWATDACPRIPADQEDTTLQMQRFLPAPGGSRIRVVHFPSRPQREAAFARGVDESVIGPEYLRCAPDLAMAHEPGGQGMHRTDTVDYGVVLSGSIWLELDDGVRKMMHPGDVVIQNGTRHRWTNEGDVPCDVLFVMIGARRE